MFSFTPKAWQILSNRSFSFPKARLISRFDLSDNKPANFFLLKYFQPKHFKISAIMIAPIFLSSCFFGSSETQLPIDAVLNESGMPVFYVDRHSFVKRYGIRGILITKDNSTACELTQNKPGERETIWGYEMATPIEEGVELNQQTLDELPKEIAYGIIPPKVSQKVTALEKNTVYHADLSVIVSQNSEVHSFRKGGLVFVLDNHGELISEDLDAMCELEKSLAEKRINAADSVAQN